MHQLFWHVHTRVYTYTHTTACPFSLLFCTEQNSMLSHFICFNKLKKCARSTTLTWFWGSARNSNIKPHLLKILNTIHMSNIRISNIACKGRFISFSGEFNGSRLTNNESHNVTSITPNLYRIVSDCSSV
jgi:hypothetical protein